jgi:hypothetical protein
MPLPVQRSVRKQNIKYLHNRILFSVEYFAFIKKILQNNVQHLLSILQQQHEDKASITNVSGFFYLLIFIELYIYLDNRRISVDYCSSSNKIPVFSWMAYKENTSVCE